MRRCKICGKPMWWWQYLWSEPIHYECAVSPLKEWLREYLKAEKEMGDSEIKKPNAKEKNPMEKCIAIFKRVSYE